MSDRILYLVPDLFGPPGGIARYCQTVCRALMESDIFFSVLSLRDLATQETAATVLGTRPYRAFGGSRLAFILNAFQQTVRMRPMIIMVGHPNFAPLGWLLARLTGARVVCFLYGIEVWERLAWHRRWPLSHMDCLIAISHYTAQQAISSNQLSAGKIRILYNCLDPQFDQPLERQVSTSYSLLTVARISQAERYKGHDYVIRALPQILQRFPDLIYDVIGDGEGRPMLERLAQQVSAAEAVRFHGRVSDEELQQYYAQASIFIMPSTHEGFGFVFAEAMAYGMPAIGGNLDATPEVIVDGETGYCVNPTSVDEIAQAVMRLLGNEDLRLRLGQQAARHVREKFSFAQFKQRLLSHLHEVTPIQ